MADVTLDLDHVVSEWGSYYINNGQNMKDLKSKIYKASETEKYFSLQLTDDTVLRSANVETTEVLQAYQDAFTPKGDSTFKPVTINLFEQKIDWRKNPQGFVASWLGFLAGDGIDRAQWPIIRYLIEQQILPRRDHDMEVEAIFKGAYVAPTPGTAGDADESMDGIRTIIRAHNDDDLTTRIATGAFEADAEDFTTQIEEFVLEMAPEVRSRLKYVFMNLNAAIKYKQGKRMKYNMSWGQTSDLMSIEDVPNIQVVGLESMGTSEMIWTSFPENMVRGEKRSKNRNVFKVETYERKVSIYTDYHKGVGFWHPLYIIHNDRDLS